MHLFFVLLRQQEGLAPQDENTIHQRKEVHHLIRMPDSPQAARAAPVEQIVGVDSLEQTALPLWLLVRPKLHHLAWVCRLSQLTNFADIHYYIIS